MAKKNKANSGYGFHHIQELSANWADSGTERIQRLMDEQIEFYKGRSVYALHGQDRSAWFDKRNPRCLPAYDARFESEDYDEAMRKYGDAVYAGLNSDSAWAEVKRVMEQVRQEKHKQFVLQHSC